MHVGQKMFLFYSSIKIGIRNFFEKPIKQTPSTFHPHQRRDSSRTGRTSTGAGTGRGANTHEASIAETPTAKKRCSMLHGTGFYATRNPVPATRNGVPATRNPVPATGNSETQLQGTAFQLPGTTRPSYTERRSSYTEQTLGASEAVSHEEVYLHGC